jgi:hypothetical protein
MIGEEKEKQTRDISSGGGHKIDQVGWVVFTLACCDAEDVFLASPAVGVALPVNQYTALLSWI